MQTVWINLAIDRELDYLIEEEIIMEQVEPTPWVSSLTFPMKPNGEVRVCLDPRNLNKAIIREHHKQMTVEEIAKVTKKYHPIRFYVMNTYVPRILISYATSYWLGLVKVLCDNKAPQIKRQVASIDKKSDFRAKDSPKRTSTQHLVSSSHKAESLSETVTSGNVPVTSPRMHNFKDAKIQDKSSSKGPTSGGGVNINDEEQHSQDETSASKGKEPKTSRTGNAVLSGPNNNITDSTKDGPLRKGATTGSNVKLGPKMKQTSKKAPCRKYYMPSNDTKTFQINNKGHLQCHQDPNFIHKPNNKGKLPGSRDAPIYHEPGRVSCKMVEDLKKLYPNSFDRLGSLKGEYNIRIDPTVKPAMHARRKVPTESKDRELDYLIEEEIIMEQVEPTPWVSSLTFPMKLNGEVRVCLDTSNLNKAIIREHHKPMTVEEIAHKLVQSHLLHKGQCFEGFPANTPHTRSISLDDVQLTQRMPSLS